MRGLGLPPTWRAAIAVSLIVIIILTIRWIIIDPYWPNPAPSFTPVQLPTLEVEP